MPAGRGLVLEMRPLALTRFRSAQVQALLFGGTKSIGLGVRGALTLGSPPLLTSC